MTPLLMLMWFVPAAVVDQPLPAGQRLLAPTLPPVLDGRLALAYLMSRNEADSADATARNITANGLAVSIRLASPATLERVADLERAGCSVDRLPSGDVANVGTVMSAFCRWEALWNLAARDWVKRVEPMTAGLTPALLPSSTTDREVEATQLREVATGIHGGQGVVIADIDSGFDPFHPFLFRADGGAYPWIDANNNGFFDPGTDSVDFNRNGKADTGERLLTLKAPITDLVNGSVYNSDGAFVAGVDWLFQDENGDGARNQGSEPPYGDLKDTFGEQLYVADDVNENGALDIGERVIRLKTPKIKAALGWAPGQPFATAPSVTYRRGINLSKLLASYPQADLAMHGTLIAGTLVGGSPHFSRYSGVAPEAELVIASYNNTNLIAALAWARREGAQIVNWERANWVDDFLDGSTNLEQACDQASAQGVLQVVAAGNLGGTRKHRQASHAQGTRSVPLTIPPNLTRSTTFSFLWREAPADQLSFTLEINGMKVSMAAPSGSASAGDDTVMWASATSTRETHLRSVRISAPTGTLLAGQTVSILVENTGATVELNSYVSDPTSGWAQGVFWPEDATDRSTLCSPSTADTALAIGSYRIDHPAAGSSKGALAAYSAQGPRIDGLRSIDLVAPDDHIASVRLTPELGEMAIGSGTSNAAPMVTAVAALLKAMTPSATTPELRERLRTHAGREPEMGTLPNDQWGAGKVRAHQAANLGEPINSSPPVARGSATLWGNRLELDAQASTDPEGELLSYQWDVDYDGTLEGQPSTAAQSTLETPHTSGEWVKLVVTDPHGRIGRTLVRIQSGAAQDAGISDAGIPEPLSEQAPEPKGCSCASSSNAMSWVWALSAVVFVRISRRLIATRLARRS